MAPKTGKKSRPEGRPSLHGSSRRLKRIRRSSEMGDDGLPFTEPKPEIFPYVYGFLSDQCSEKHHRYHLLSGAVAPGQKGDCPKTGDDVARIVAPNTLVPICEI